MTADPAPGDRWIDYVDVETLPLATRNPKDHDIGGLINSLHRFDFTQPGLLDERTGQLVAGHGRFEAVARVRDGKGQPPEGVRVDDQGRWLVPVVRGWASRDDRHAEAYLVYDNKGSEVGGWNKHLLAEVLVDIAESTPVLLAATGVDGDDLDQLLADVALADSSSPAPWDQEASAGVKEWTADDEKPSATDDADDTAGAGGPKPLDYDPSAPPPEHECPSCGYTWPKT